MRSASADDCLVAAGRGRRSFAGRPLFANRGWRIVAKRGTNQTPPMATAGAVAHATGNQTAVNLHAWASQPDMPAAHSPEAHQERRAPPAPLTPEQARAFGEANDHHETSHLQK